MVDAVGMVGAVGAVAMSIVMTATAKFGGI